MAESTHHLEPAVVGPLRLSALFRRAFATYRMQVGRVTGIALVVFLLPALVSTGVDEWAENHGRHHPSVMAVLLIMGVVEMGISTLSSTFYAGVLDEVVDEDQHGHERRSIRQLVRSLPLVRLVLASLVVSAVTGIAELAFVVPGMVLYTFLAITGPVINIENLGVFAAIKRSFGLIRPKFWFAFFAVTIPVTAEALLDDYIDELFHGSRWLAALAIDGVLKFTVLTMVGLIEVTLAYELIARDRARSAAITETGSHPEPHGREAAG